MHPLQRSLSIILLISLLVTGCWDAREIEERASVIALGVDDHPNGIEVSVQMPIPIKVVSSGGGGGGESGQNAVQLFSGQGKTMSDALEDIENQSNQRLFFGHARVIILSESVVRKGIGEFLDFLRREPEIRRRQWPMVVKGTAKDALKTSPKLTQIPMEYLVDMVEAGVRFGHFADVSLGDLFTDISNPAKEPILNYMEVKPYKIQWVGLALLKGDRLVKVLKRKESENLLRIRDEMVGETWDVPCGGDQGHLVIFPTKMKREIKVKQHKDVPKINIHLTLEGSVSEKICEKVELDHPGIYSKINRLASIFMEKRAQQLIQDIQKTGVDSFSIGNHIRAHHPDLWKRIDWKKVFPKADIRVIYHVNIRRIGLKAK